MSLAAPGEWARFKLQCLLVPLLHGTAGYKLTNSVPVFGRTLPSPERGQLVLETEIIFAAVSSLLHRK